MELESLDQTNEDDDKTNHTITFNDYTRNSADDYEEHFNWINENLMSIFICRYMYIIDINLF